MLNRKLSLGAASVGGELASGALGAEREQLAAPVRPVAPPLVDRGALVDLAPALGTADRPADDRLVVPQQSHGSKLLRFERRHQMSSAAGSGVLLLECEAGARPRPSKETTPAP